jgi:hypothetical protein
MPQPQPCASRPAELGPALRCPARSLARPSRDPGQPKLCVCETCRQRPAEPRQPAWIGPAQAPIGALPRPANDAHTDIDRNRKGAPSPLAAMVRRLTKLASVSPWRGAGAVGRQAGSAGVRTRHSHAVPPGAGRRGRWRHRAHRGRWRHRTTCLKAGEFLLVKLIGRRSRQRRHLVVRGRVGNVMRVMMVLCWRCRSCI